MNAKIMAAIAAVVLVVVVLAAIGISMDDDDNSHITEGVIYDGNGGSYNGTTRFEITSHEVMSNLFEREGFEFASWNTKADGTGTPYNPSDNIDYAPGKTVTLYAQWQTPGPRVTSMSTGGPVIPLTETLNGKELNLITCSFIRLTATGNVIELQYGKEVKWSLESNVFKIVDGTDTYTVTIDVNNAKDVVYSINGEGKPTVTFSVDQDITISINVKHLR